MLGAFIRTDFFKCFFFLYYNVTQGEVGWPQKCFKSPVVYSTDRSKAVVPVLVLLFVAVWFILRGDLFFVLHCVILFLCFSVLLALRKRASLGAFRTFVQFALV